MTQQQICRVPKFLEFAYHFNQKLNTTMHMDNLVDRVVSFKIKSNRPQLYLVKPMQGSIYKKQTVKITFNRKALSKEDFQSYLHSPNPIPQQKFLIQFKYSDLDPVGREKVVSQTALVTVRFRAEQTASTVKQPTNKAKQSNPKEQQIKLLEQQLTKTKQELSQLRQDESQMQKTKNKHLEKLDYSNLAHLIVLFLLAGLAI